MALITADWNPLGDVFYRKLELYSMEWRDHIDVLSKFTMAAAPYGGPIALILTEAISQTSQGHSKPNILIFSSAGHLISSIKWSSGHIIFLAWTLSEELLCVQDDGTVLVYDIFGTYKRVFSMGQEAKDVKIVDSLTFHSHTGTGLAILTSSYHLYVVNNVDEPKLRRITEVPGLVSQPSSWAVISQDRQSRVLLAKQSELYLLDHGGQYQRQNPPINSPVSAYIDLAVSFNHKYLAMFTDTGMLWIGSSDLQKVYCEFDTKCPSKPKQLVWCATGAIVGCWEKLLLMVGPKKDWVKYNTDGAVHLVPEMDGLRIIGKETHDFLQRVPGVVQEIFKIGSMSPGAMLYEASREYQRGSQKADEYIRMVRASNELYKAVEQCIQAAGCEYESSIQRILLKAASFGKNFLSDMKPEMFVNMCQMLRVLNAVRDYQIGIPLTYAQLQHLSLKVLVDRLILRHQWPLAIKICKYLRLPKIDGESRVLAHWACFKVVQMNDDEEIIARTIQMKLGDTPGISYSEIAAKAAECGRIELAVRLLEYESKASEQVPLLMRLKYNDLALSKAVESGDTDLVYTVMMHLKKMMSRGDFLLTIRNIPIVYSLYMQYCKDSTTTDTLADLFYQSDDFQGIANCKVSDSYKQTDLDSRLTCLYEAQDNYVKAKHEFASKATEDQIKLMRLQKRFEEDYDQRFLDLSLHDTIYNLIKFKRHKPVEQLRKEFKITDRSFWWLKIHALGEFDDWVELEKFSKSKKSPIGYEPFVEICLKCNNITEANKYISKVPPENKVKMYIKTGNLEQAAELAFQQRNENDLNIILKKCSSSNRSLVEKIQNLIASLSMKK